MAEMASDPGMETLREKTRSLIEFLEEIERQCESRSIDNYEQHRAFVDKLAEIRHSCFPPPGTQPPTIFPKTIPQAPPTPTATQPAETGPETEKGRTVATTHGPRPRLAPSASQQTGGKGTEVPSRRPLPSTRGALAGSREEKTSTWTTATASSNNNNVSGPVVTLRQPRALPSPPSGDNDSSGRRTLTATRNAGPAPASDTGSTAPRKTASQQPPQQSRQDLKRKLPPATSTPAAPGGEEGPEIKRLPAVKIKRRRQKPVGDDAPLEEWIEYIKGHDSHFKHASSGKSSPMVLRLVGAMFSRSSMWQAFRIVRASRDEDSRRTWSGAFKPISDRFQQAANLTSLVDRHDRVSELNRFIAMLARINLADVVDHGKGDRTRADPEFITETLERLGWKGARSRARLQQITKVGRQWRNILREDTALLCFVPLTAEAPYHVTQADYARLNEEQLSGFHKALLGRSPVLMEAICKMGQAFQDTILSGRDIVFGWEEVEETEFFRASDATVLSLLEPIPLTHGDYTYAPGKFPDWQRPTDWPEGWPWPANPTLVPPHERQCDMCSAEACDCIATLLADNIPRVTNYDGKGRGIRAVGVKPGWKVYGAGQYVGVLVGELQPPSAPPVPGGSKWIAELRRTDIPFEPTVAHVDTSRMGNWVRMANHCCKPSAEFTGRRISGAFRELLQACRDIYDGEEITVSYGKSFWSGPCPCDTCDRGRAAKGHSADQGAEAGGSGNGTQSKP